MKNTSYKNKQFVLLGMTFLSVAGIAGCSKVELAQSTVTLELGDELSENVADMFSAQNQALFHCSQRQPHYKAFRCIRVEVPQTRCSPMQR